mmetsp:Transcript_43202/g.101592  ORF Transcript_43202/g.101592 Transcript_43202/m.101592 type:complete len:673 (-) Transcript_43202:41-2059(-)
MEPSAPPPPLVLSEQEFDSLTACLEAGTAPLPTSAQLNHFRRFTTGRLLWVAQARALATGYNGGAHLLREAYERQLLVDPWNLGPSDGDWVQAMRGADPSRVAAEAHAATAFVTMVPVIHFGGAIAEVAMNTATATVADALQGAGHLGRGNTFDPENDRVFAVAGSPPEGSAGEGIMSGSLVRVTGLVQNEALNGAIGQVVQQEQDQFTVATQQGVLVLHRDNLMPFTSDVITRNRGLEVLPETPLQCLGPGVRLMWLKQPGTATPLMSAGASTSLGTITRQVRLMDLSGDGRISAGEFRNFLWNLHMSDPDFEKVLERFSPKNSRSGQCYLDLEDINFLLGRPHMRARDVPIDALIYEAVVSILGRQTTAHIDRDLSSDSGVGFKAACAQHCASLTLSLLLQGAIYGCLIYSLFCVLIDESDEVAPFLIGAACTYLIYLIHVCCCVRLTGAFNHPIEGIEEVCAAMDKPRSEDPHYRWHVQCYHYETRYYTETRQENGRTVHETKSRRERVNTHQASMRGVIPSKDFSPEFVPQTEAQQTHVTTALDLDLSRSNYVMEYEKWCHFHRWDAHQDRSRSEDMPSRLSNCFAVWVTHSLPCWMNNTCYWLSNLLMMSACYRWCAHSKIGYQSYTYVKRCFDIPTFQPCGAEVGVAAACMTAGVAMNMLEAFSRP